MVGSILAGFVLLALVYYMAEEARTKAYTRAQEEWRFMEERLYAVNVPNTKSPYVPKTMLHSRTKELGYAIYDKRSCTNVGDAGYYKFFKNIQAAAKYMNELEIIGGFDLTVYKLPDEAKPEDSIKDSV